MEKNRIFLLLIIFMQSTTQSSDFFKWDWNQFLDGFMPWMYFGGVLLAGRGVEYIEREIIVTDRCLNKLKEMLSSQEYWNKEENLIIEKHGNLDEIRERKEKIKNTIERMEKIKAERQKKKEEAEEKKRKQQEENKTFYHNGCCRGGISHFFFVKNMMKDPNYNQWLQNRVLATQRISLQNSLSAQRSQYVLLRTAQKLSHYYGALQQITQKILHRMPSEDTFPNLL